MVLLLLVALAAPFDDDVTAYKALGVTLASTTDHAQRAELELQRARVLRRVVYGAHDANAFEAFCKDNKPAVVRIKTACVMNAEQLWSTAKTYSSDAAGDAMAWEAAIIPPAVSCPNDRACSRRQAEATYGRYIKAYPTGSHADEARALVNELRDEAHQ